MNQPCASGGVLLAELGGPGLAVHLAAVGQRGRRPGEHDLAHQRPQRVQHRPDPGPPGLGPAGSAPTTSTGAAGVPLATPAATSAICAGLISTSPWPMAFAAFVVPVLSAGTLPLKMPTGQLPVGADAVGRRGLGERAVGQLQRLLDEGRVARLREGLRERHGAEVELVLVLELAALDRRWSPGRATGVSGVERAGRQQRRGGDRLHARAGRELAGQRVAGVGGLVGARRRGSRRCPGRTTTRCVGSCWPATAASAAFCTAGTSGVCSGVPGSGATAAISRPCVAGGLVGAHDRDGEARRCRRAAPGRPAAARTARAGHRRRSAATPSSCGLLDDLGGGRADPAQQRERRTGGSAPSSRVLGREDRAGQVEDLRRGSPRSPDGAG